MKEQTIRDRVVGRESRVYPKQGKSHHGDFISLTNLVRLVGKLIANFLFLLGVAALFIVVVSFLAIIYYAFDQSNQDPGLIAYILRDFWYCMIPLSFLTLLGKTRLVKGKGGIIWFVSHLGDP